MFPLEQGAFEMILIGAIALIVVGPKDLPMLMRKVGQFTAKMRGLAAEFRASFEEMARQSELDELRKEVEALRTGAYVAPISAEIDQHLSDLNRYPSLPAEAPLQLESAQEPEAPVAPVPKARAKKVPEPREGASRVRAPAKPRTPKLRSAAAREADG